MTNQTPKNIFANITMAPPDPIIDVYKGFFLDTAPNKINLSAGIYRDNQNKPFVFKVVKKVQQQIINDPTLNKEYLMPEGFISFNIHSQKLVFGQNSEAVNSQRIFTIQSISGAGSLRIGFEFLNQEAPSLVWVPDPSWPNHIPIINRSGLKAKQYPYYNPKTNRFDLQNCLKCLNQAQEGNIVVLHSAAHNPTGADPSIDEWKQLAEFMKKRNLIPFFDSAYQGFATGDLNEDSWSIRYFTDLGLTVFVAQSYSKSMGLYGERVGALHIVTADKQTAKKVASKLSVIVRGNYGSPQLHGARIVQKILSNPVYFQEWQTELKEITGTPGKCLLILGQWSHITEQKGMFSFSGLSPNQVRVLKQKHHIHMTSNGRIPIPGVNTGNVDQIAKAIKDVVQNVQ